MKNSIGSFSSFKVRMENSISDVKKRFAKAYVLQNISLEEIQEVDKICNRLFELSVKCDLNGK